MAPVSSETLQESLYELPPLGVEADIVRTVYTSINGGSGCEGEEGMGFTLYGSDVTLDLPDTDTDTMGQGTVRVVPGVSPISLPTLLKGQPIALMQIWYSLLRNGRVCVYHPSGRVSSEAALSLSYLAQPLRLLPRIIPSLTLSLLSTLQDTADKGPEGLIGDPLSEVEGVEAVYPGISLADKSQCLCGVTNPVLKDNPSLWDCVIDLETRTVTLPLDADQKETDVKPGSRDCKFASYLLAGHEDENRSDAWVIEQWHLYTESMLRHHLGAREGDADPALAMRRGSVSVSAAASSDTLYSHHITQDTPSKHHVALIYPGLGGYAPYTQWVKAEARADARAAKRYAREGAASLLAMRQGTVGERGTPATVLGVVKGLSAYITQTQPSETEGEGEGEGVAEVRRDLSRMEVAERAKLFSALDRVMGEGDAPDTPTLSAWVTSSLMPVCCAYIHSDVSRLREYAATALARLGVYVAEATGEEADLANLSQTYIFQVSLSVSLPGLLSDPLPCVRSAGCLLSRAVCMVAGGVDMLIRCRNDMEGEGIASIDCDSPSLIHSLVSISLSDPEEVCLAASRDALHLVYRRVLSDTFATKDGPRVLPPMPPQWLLVQWCKGLLSPDPKVSSSTCSLLDALFVDVPACIGIVHTLCGMGVGGTTGGGVTGIMKEICYRGYLHTRRVLTGGEEEEGEGEGEEETDEEEGAIEYLMKGSLALSPPYASPSATDALLPNRLTAYAMCHFLNLLDIVDEDRETVEGSMHGGTLDSVEEVAGRLSSSPALAYAWLVPRHDTLKMATQKTISNPLARRRESVPEREELPADVRAFLSAYESERYRNLPTPSVVLDILHQAEEEAEAEAPSEGTLAIESETSSASSPAFPLAFLVRVAGYLSSQSIGWDVPLVGIEGYLPNACVGRKRVETTPFLGLVHTLHNPVSEAHAHILSLLHGVVSASGRAGDRMLSYAGGDILSVLPKLLSSTDIPPLHPLDASGGEAVGLDMAIHGLQSAISDGLMLMHNEGKERERETTRVQTTAAFRANHLLSQALAVLSLYVAQLPKTTDAHTHLDHQTDTHHEGEEGTNASPPPSPGVTKEGEGEVQPIPVVPGVETDRPPINPCVSAALTPLLDRLDAMLLGLRQNDRDRVAVDPVVVENLRVAGECTAALTQWVTSSAYPLLRVVGVADALTPSSPLSPVVQGMDMGMGMADDGMYAMDAPPLAGVVPGPGSSEIETRSGALSDEGEAEAEGEGEGEGEGEEETAEAPLDPGSQALIAYVQTLYSLTSGLIANALNSSLPAVRALVPYLESSQAQTGKGVGREVLGERRARQSLVDAHSLGVGAFLRVLSGHLSEEAEGEEEADDGQGRMAINYRPIRDKDGLVDGALFPPVTKVVVPVGYMGAAPWRPLASIPNDWHNSGTPLLRASGDHMPSLQTAQGSAVYSGVDTLSTSLALSLLKDAKKTKPPQYLADLGIEGLLVKNPGYMSSKVEAKKMNKKRQRSKAYTFWSQQLSCFLSISQHFLAFPPTQEDPYLDDDGIEWYNASSGSFSDKDITAGQWGYGALICPTEASSVSISCTVSPDAATENLLEEDEGIRMMSVGNMDPVAHIFTNPTPYEAFGSCWYDEVSVTFPLTSDIPCVVLQATSSVTGAALSCEYVSDPAEQATQTAVTGVPDLDEGMWYTESAGEISLNFTDKPFNVICPGEVTSLRVVCDVEDGVNTDEENVMLYLLEVGLGQHSLDYPFVIIAPSLLSVSRPPPPSYSHTSLDAATRSNPSTFADADALTSSAESVLMFMVVASMDTVVELENVDSCVVLRGFYSAGDASGMSCSYAPVSEGPEDGNEEDPEDGSGIDPVVIGIVAGVAVVVLAVAAYFLLRSKEPKATPVEFMAHVGAPVLMVTPPEETATLDTAAQPV
ncbi:hypothetical protein KIPB_001215 [Kipferlia bialata]|uniref:Uncharacterized protein n=1 Tax=Kipferlia bialata TaxID=797122 RepID=A0A9K3CNF6_9EUKA|nr:hypothetical protein KIPB_001215 [Kipferlia bialata]|eukprot:g1215.t1